MAVTIGNSNGTASQQVPAGNQNIQVFVRCRPQNPHEKRCVVDVLPERKEIRVHEKNSHDPKSFYFDRVFGPDSLQVDVYKAVVWPLIDQVLLGFNCTVFAYGQTGTGKTYTMEGERSNSDLSWEDDPTCGIIPRALSQLFETLSAQDNEFTVRVSFLELYNEDTYDLLSGLEDTTKLKIYDDSQKKGSVIIGGLEEIIVRSKSEIYDILRRGSSKRQTAATLLNACSSRSHTIFSVTLHIKEASMDGEELLKIGKLNLVDLAGSENIGRSGAQDKRAREAGNINQSLLTLGRVITALVEKRPHVPYRESKLTRLLQDSLGGKTKTSIIATVSPAVADAEDTLSTLEYASRAKKITNKPEMNQRLTKKALLREYTQEIERLRRDLQASREKNGVYLDVENYKELCAQSTTIQEKEERLLAVQEEAKKISELFEATSNKLKETEANLKQIEENLKEKCKTLATTENILHEAKEECEKQKILVDAHKQTEEKLASQAVELIEVAQQATSDINLLHGKVDRIKSVERENQTKIGTYHEKVRDAMSKLESFSEVISNEFKVESRQVVEKISQMVNSNMEAMKEINKNLTLAMKMVDTVQSNMSDVLDVISHHADKIESLSATMETSQRREIGSRRNSFERFVTYEIKKEEQTGQTPQRKTYAYPRILARTSPYDKILERSKSRPQSMEGDICE
ncbi:Kinesin-like protein KIF11, partial [Fragariocoptes setiger]